MPSIHHLIRSTQAETLLKEFALLIPGSGLALFRPDGTLFAAADKADIASAPPGSSAPHTLFAAGEPVALLVAHPQGAGLLPVLRHTLDLLLASALEKREIARETIDRYREINLLYHTSETIGACLNVDEIPSLVLGESGRVIPADAGLVLLRAQHGAGEPELCAASPPDEPRQAGGRIPRMLAAAAELIDHVLKTGRSDIRTSAAFGALLCAPLNARERVLGAVLLGREAASALPGKAQGENLPEEIAQFTAGEQKLLLALAGQAGIAIEKAWMHLQELEQQRLEQEMAIGRRIQHSLLPESLPSLAGWEFAAYYQAAREVGGDFYDFFEPMASPNPPGAQDRRDSSHSLGLFIADVTGKGVPAALMMAFSRALLRTLLRTGAQLAGRPAEVLRRMNSLLLHDNRTGLLLTALYAALDPASGRLFYANAGHERPVWVRTAARECIELISPGAILGAFPHFAFEERQVDLAPGDLIVFYTDGVTEARNPQGALFGEERLLETLTAGLGAGAEETAQTILGAVQGFAAGTPQADDFTVVVIQRSGN